MQKMINFAEREISHFFKLYDGWHYGIENKIMKDVSKKLDQYLTCTFKGDDLIIEKYLEYGKPLEYSLKSKCQYLEK